MLAVASYEGITTKGYVDSGVTHSMGEQQLSSGQVGLASVMDKRTKHRLESELTIIKL